MLHADLFNSNEMVIDVVDLNIKLARELEYFLSLSFFRGQQIAYQYFRRYCFFTQFELKTALLISHAYELTVKRKEH